MAQNLIYNLKAQVTQPMLLKMLMLLSLILIIFIFINNLLWQYTKTLWLLHPESQYAHWIHSDYFLLSYFLSISPLLLWFMNLTKTSKIFLKIIAITLIILVISNQFLAGFVGYSIATLLPVTVVTFYLFFSTHNFQKSVISKYS